MSMIDNTIASQMPVYDAALPLAQAAKVQQAQQAVDAEKLKVTQNAIGAEMRGLTPFVNTPEFVGKWAESIDGMVQKGLIPQEVGDKMRSQPSALMHKSIIAQTDSPEMAYNRDNQARVQGNADREYSRSVVTSDRNYGLAANQDRRAAGAAARDKADWENAPDQYGTGPNGEIVDRLAEAQARAQLIGAKMPSGFEPNPEGGLRPIAGGPSDPKYLRTVTDKQNAPSGYKWADPNNPDAGLEPIPGGPGEKVPAEVAARLGLAKSFIGQLSDYTDVEGNPQKGLRARIKAGDATGIFDGPMAEANVGEAGSIRRKVSSGAEALLRNLTGAGMNIDEAKKYVARYEPQWNDSATTLVDKINQLERELRAIDDTVSKGRGGSVITEKPGANSAARAADPLGIR